MRSRFVTVLLACSAALLASGGTAASVSAAASSTSAQSVSPQSAQLPGLVSPTPVSYTPDISAEGCGSVCNPATVYATAVVNGEVVVAGAFTQVCTPAPDATYAACPDNVTADYIFAFNPANGFIDQDFTPSLNGSVATLAAGPDDTVYVGGNFTTVDGAPHEGVVQLSVTPGESTDGQVVSAFTGQTTGDVSNLDYNGTALYVGGTFSKIDNVKQHGLGRLNATTGAFDTSFEFTLGDAVSGTSLQVQSMALTPDGDTLAIGGTFQQVNGNSQSRVALISTGGGFGSKAALDDWMAPIFENNCSREHAYVDGIDFSPDGSFFVVADSGYSPAGDTPGICDASARFETAATGDDVQPVWINYSGGDTQRSVAIAGSVVYLGGHNRWVNNQCGNNHVCDKNAVLVNGLAALDVNTGLALPYWHPGTLRGVGVQSLVTYPAGTFAGSDGGLLLGTDTNIIGGATHDMLAMFPLTSTATPAAGGPIPSGMYALGNTKGAPGLCVDDSGDSSTAGTAVEQETCANDAEQNWAESGGTLTVNGLCLDTNSGKAVVNTCDGDSSQQWSQGAGNTLVNQASGECLTDPGASTKSGTQLDTSACTSGNAAQEWPLPEAPAPPAPPPVGPVYSAITQENTEQVLCITDAGDAKTSPAVAQLATCSMVPAQNPTVESNGTITVNGLCLDTQGGATTSGTPVVYDTCDGNASQQWLPESAYAYSLVNQASGLCLTDPNSGDTNDIQMQIQACGQGKDQEWRLPTV